MEEYVQKYQYYNDNILDYIEITDKENPIVKNAVLLS